MSSITREQFRGQVLEHIKQRFPLVRIAHGEGPFSLRINGQIAELENIYRMVLLSPADRQRHMDRWVVELLRAAEGTPDRTGPFEEVRERILPMILCPGLAQTHHTSLTQPLIGDLSIGYAIDSDRTISYISQERFAKWKIPLDILHEAAVANLVTRSDGINAHAAEDESGNINLIMFQTLDGYDASRILLPTLHERLRSYLGSPFVAAVPNRDLLLCFRNDPETVERIEEKVADDFRHMPHQVTDHLLLVTADGLAAK